MSTASKSKKELVKQFLDETPADFEYFVQHSMDFSIQLSSLLKKYGKSQKELARELGKEESEISKWLSGNHNFTLKSIAKIESALDQQLIFTRSEIIEKFLPFLFRNWKSTYYQKDNLDSLITHYTFSENEIDSSSFGISSNANYELTSTNTDTVKISLANKKQCETQSVVNNSYSETQFINNKAA